MYKVLFVLGALALSVASQQSNQSLEENVAIDYRLPISAIPTHYEIQLEPSFEAFDFTGQVSIVIEVINTTSTIVMHAHNLEINNVSVQDNDELYKSHKLVDDSQFLVINLTNELPSGAYATIKIRYKGVLNGNSQGFYKASYLDQDGTEKWIATTQFESTFARQAFPCFDEPALKATFKINIIRDADKNAIANTGLESQMP